MLILDYYDSNYDFMMWCSPKHPSNNQVTGPKIAVGTVLINLLFLEHLVVLIVNIPLHFSGELIHVTSRLSLSIDGV